MLDWQVSQFHCTCQQVHMVFKFKVTPTASPLETAEKELLFVRYYCTSSEEDRVKDLSFRHLEWESVSLGKGPSRKSNAVWTAGPEESLQLRHVVSSVLRGQAFPKYLLESCDLNFSKRP